MVQGEHLRVDEALQEAGRALSSGAISASTLENLSIWLTDESFHAFVPDILHHIAEASWLKLEEVFWTTIPFGTAGRRGRMYPFGTNAINERTIGETVQALAEYVVSVRPADGPPTCAVAYDSRYKSDEFARLSAEILAGAEFEVYFFDEPRSTPCLATTVLHKRCDCGIMITASHNPPTDNAIKVYWSNSGQLLPAQADTVAERMVSVKRLQRKPFDQADVDGQIHFCKEEMDSYYHGQVLALREPDSADSSHPLRILYSPLEGVGGTSVPGVLEAAGFASVEVYGPHAEPSAAFRNVPGGVANPEDPRVFDCLIEHAKGMGAELVLASDPDADRLGCAAPVTLAGSQWQVLSGNQIGVLIADYLLERHQDAGTLSPDHYLIKTLVTSDMVLRLAEDYGVSSHGDVLTGFKWIGALIDELGPERFVFGFEEANGYLAGTHCRDKDGAVAALLMAELADRAKSAGLSVHQKLDQLYNRVGCHVDRTISLAMTGAGGARRTDVMMQCLSDGLPRELGGMVWKRTRDYHDQLIRYAGGDTEPMKGPQANLLIIELDESGNYFAARPSGTEPKIKFYFFAYEPPGAEDLETVKQHLNARITNIAADVFDHVRVDSST